MGVTLSFTQELDISLHSCALLLRDNQSALHIATNPVFHTCTWHIDIDLHFLCELVACKAIQLQHISTIFQLFDIFTKRLSHECFLLLCLQLQLYELALQLQENVKENIHSYYGMILILSDSTLDVCILFFFNFKRLRILIRFIFLFRLYCNIINYITFNQ